MRGKHGGVIMKSSAMKAALGLTILASSCVELTTVPTLAADSAALRSYNAPIGESSISGISSGAFMAVQFATAWSSVIKGVGVIAGGPDWCAEADAYDIINGYTLPILHATGQCMKGPPPVIDLNALLAKVDSKAASGDIDPTSNLSQQKIYLFHGYNDAVVSKPVTDAAANFYRHYLGVAGAGNLYYQSALGAWHSLVVLMEPGVSGLNGCGDNTSPYIDQCGYDQAGIALQHIYGALNPPNRGTLAGTMKSFDQSIYSKPDIPDALSLGDTGYVFVPKDCEDGGSCRVHIALHGCKQDAGDIGRRFVDDTGYNSWADTNHLIVLYPQTKSSPFLPSNPEACWDWWSYIDHTDGYITKSGAQIRTIKAMVDSLTAGVMPVAIAAATSAGTPAGLTVTDTSDTGAALAWSPVDGASAYRVQRAAGQGAFTPVGEVAGPSYGDAGLTPQAPYRWRISAIMGGVEEPPSADAVATTRPTSPRCDNPGSCPVVK
jgi:poly(3-hydroxybutyrate) depolymerase